MLPRATTSSQSPAVNTTAENAEEGKIQGDEIDPAVGIADPQQERQQEVAEDANEAPNGSLGMVEFVSKLASELPTIPTDLATEQEEGDSNTMPQVCSETVRLLSRLLFWELGGAEGQNGRGGTDGKMARAQVERTSHALLFCFSHGSSLSDLANRGGWSSYRRHDAPGLRAWAYFVCIR